MSRDLSIKLTLLLVSLAYLVFEFSFNATLLDTAASLSAGGEEIEAVERFGRTVAGAGLALLVVSLFAGERWQLGRPGWRIAAFAIAALMAVPFAFAGADTATRVAFPIAGAGALALALWLRRGALRGALVVAGLVTACGPGMYYGQLVLFERVLVEGSSAELRQSARYVNLLKVGLRNGAVQFENAPFDAGRLDDPDQKTFLALLGGLAWLEDDVVETVKENRRQIADLLVARMSARGMTDDWARYQAQRDRFIAEAWEPFKAASKDFASRYNDARGEAERRWATLQDRIAESWSDYQQDRERFRGRLAQKSGTVHKYLTRALEDYGNCGENARCQQREIRQWHGSRVNKEIERQLGVRTHLLRDWCWEREPTTREKIDRGIKVLENPLGELFGRNDVNYLSCVTSQEQTTDRLMLIGRDKFAARSGGYPPDLANLAAFKVHPITAERVRERLAEDGIDLPESWVPVQKRRFIAEVAPEVQKRARAQWNREMRRRFGAVLAPDLSFDQFARHPALQDEIRARVDADMASDIDLTITDPDVFVDKVVRPEIQARIDREIEILRADVATYADGGGMAAEGKQAVRAALIPPISLFLSLFFGLVTLAKNGYALAAIPAERLPAGVRRGVLGVVGLALAGGLLATPFAAANSFSTSATFLHYRDIAAERAPATALAAEFVIRIQPLAYPVGRAAKDWTAADRLFLEGVLAHAPKALPDDLDRRLDRLNREAGRDALRATQRELKAAGHYTGALDGLYGPKTRRALIAGARAGDITPLMAQYGIEKE